jgi:hypothetical protein
LRSTAATDCQPRTARASRAFTAVAVDCGHPRSPGRRLVGMQPREPSAARTSSTAGIRNRTNPDTSPTIRRRSHFLAQQPLRAQWRLPADNATRARA